MSKPTDPAALDPETRRLVERGVREAFGLSLAEFLDDVKIGGVGLTADDIEGLRLAGELAERAGLPEPAVPVDSSPTAAPVDIATLDVETLRLADRR